MTAQLPKAGPSLSQRDAQLVIAREHGFVGWRDLKAKVLERSGQGLEWAFDQARRAIHERNVGRLKQLIEQYPVLLSREEGRSASLVAATLPFLLDAAAHQQTQTRPECIEALIDAGIPIEEDAWKQLISSRSAPMLELLQRKGVLPETLAIRAALGDVSALRACLDDSGALRPFAFSRGKSELDSVNQAFLYACRNAHAAAATVVLQRCIALDPALGSRIDGWQGRAAFVAYMCEHLVGVVRDSGESLPPWTCSSYISSSAASAMGNWRRFAAGSSESPICSARGSRSSRCG